MTTESKCLRRCDRNRKRSRRRALYCPIHECHLDSASPKHSLYADQAAQLQQRGVSRKNSLLLVATQSTVSLNGEWLEALWCKECQETRWFHVRKLGPSSYELSVAPVHLWQQAVGVIDPKGNPTVGDFTRRQARMLSQNQIKDFKFM